MNEASSKRSRGACLKWAAVLLLLGVGAVWPTGSVPDRFLVNAVFDALHFPAGWLLGMALMALIPGDGLGRLILRGALGFTAALAVEWIQGFVGRSPSWADLLWGCAGLAVALMWQRRSIRGWVVLVVILAVPASLHPIYGAVRAVAWRNQRGAVIGDFEQRWQMALWSPNEAQTRADWATGGESLRGRGSLRVGIGGEDGYAGVSSAVGNADWLQWGQLTFRLRNLGPPISVGVRIRDAHWSGVHADQLNWGATLPEGDSAWRIDLETVLSSGRKLDRASVRDLAFFVRSGPGAEGFLLDEVRLE